MNKPKNASTNFSAPKGNWIYWGGLWIPESSATEHFGLIGASGSGKTKTIQLLVQSIVPRIFPGSNTRMLLYDAKRDVYGLLRGMGVAKHDIWIMNPFDARSAAWNMSADITDPASAMEVATELIPSKGEVQKFFPEAARALVGGIMESFVYLAPGRWTLRDVALSLRNDTRLRRILRHANEAMHLIDHYLSEGQAHRDIIATISNTMRRLGFVAAAWQHTDRLVSLKDWLHSESILLLGSNPSLHSTIQQLNSAIINRVTQLILSEPEAVEFSIPPRTWIIIDELRKAGRLENLPEFMVEGRSKGAGVVGGFQDVPGLIEVYGPNLSQELFGACRNKAFLKLSDHISARYASDHFGTIEMEIRRWTRNSGSSISISRRDENYGSSQGTSEQRTNHSRPAINAREFMCMPEANQMNGISGFYDTACVGAPYFATLPGELFDNCLCKADPLERNVEPRPAEHQILREWDRNDLERLGLGNFPELLSAPQGKPKKRTTKTKKSKRPKLRGDSDDGLLGLLPNINL